MSKQLGNYIDEDNQANSSDEGGLDENLVMSAAGANNSQDLI